VGFANSGPYIASKHAVIGRVKGTALELAGFGIRVNAIAPGAIDNRMIESVISQFSGCFALNRSPTGYRLLISCAKYSP